MYGQYSEMTRRGQDAFATPTPRCIGGYFRLGESSQSRGPVRSVYSLAKGLGALGGIDHLRPAALVLNSGRPRSKGPVG